MQDTALLCNPLTQRFRPALPYAMVTHDFHYIPTTVLKEAGQAPSGLHVAKQYFRPHIDSIVAEWERTLTLGKGAAEEWVKGLGAMGKQTALDSARWEHWEAKGGFNRVLFAFKQLQPAPLLHPTPTPGWVQNNMLGWPIHSLAPQQQQFGAPPGANVATLLQQTAITPMNFTPTQSQAQFSPQASFPGPFPQSVPPAPPQPVAVLSQSRQDRNPRDAEDAKAARRQQIEQLCLTELDPPIPPNVLRHMPAFRAAILIGIPLNDTGWENLKPKLLEQCEQALAMERETTRQLLAVQQQVQAETKRQANHNAKDTRDAQEKEWEDKLRPQRDRLSAIADSYIQQHWRGGQSVNSGNVARFAMSVFDHVRRVWYAEQQTSDQVSIMLGRQLPSDPPDGPFLRRLTLETMKWVYDHMVRPLTRDYGKEIFFCNGAGCEFTNKHFAFEGVIQHYGAKHTNDYSRGNVIVHWQTADWPEDLPFYDPGSGPSRPHYGTGGYSRGTTISPRVSSGPPYSVPSLTTSPLGATPRSVFGHGPFTPPVGSGYLPQLLSQHSTHQHPGLNPASQPPALLGSDPTDLSQFFQTTAHHMADPVVAKAVTDRDAAEKLSSIIEQLTAKSAQSVGTAAGLLPPEEKKTSIMDLDVPDFAAFQDQQKYVAETARFAWARTNAIDGMPSNVRVFAVLQYTLLQFSQRFRTKLPVDTFATALMNNSGLESLKHANGLFCKQCTTDARGSTSPLTVVVDLWTLTEHFQKVHAPKESGGHVDNASSSWAKEMIALPAPEIIPELLNAPGMKDEKLVILADAFPGQLPRRMPHSKTVKDHTSARQGRKSKRNDRKASNGRRQDFEAAVNGDDEDSGHTGFRSSHSPPDASNSRRRSPKHHEHEDEDEYDPAKPMLSDKTRKRRDYARKSSGMGGGPSLEEMLRIETEKSNRAAAEENRRRGIISEPHAEATPFGEAHYEHLRVTDSHSQPESAPKPIEMYPEHHERARDRVSSNLVDHPHPDTTYLSGSREHPPVDRSQQAEYHYPERTASRPTHLSRDGYPGGHATATPPSGRKGRYARYDEQHERFLRDRTRSRSPVRFEGPTYDRQPARQRESGIAEPDSLRYRYAAEPGGIIYDQYGRRLVPVSDDAARPGHPVHGRALEEMQYLDPRQALYDQQLYVSHQDPRYAPQPTYNSHTGPYTQPPLPTRDSRYAE